MNTPAPRPPIVHTHRKPGKVDVKAARARAYARTAAPTHRGEPRPTLDELRAVNANIGRTHA